MSYMLPRGSETERLVARLPVPSDALTLSSNSLLVP